MKILGCVAAVGVANLVPVPRPAYASAAPFEVSSDAFGVDANAHSSAPSVDGDGSLIAFESDATNLLPAGQDSNSVRDIFVKNVGSGAIVRVSVDSYGGQSNGSSYAPSIDSKGDIVAYDSVARNLDSNLTNDCAHGLGDCNRKQDVFIHSLTTGANLLISKTFDGLRSGDGTATAPIISADGSTVLYQSNDDDLTCSAPPCTQETMKYWNIYSYDIATGVNTLLTPGENGDSKFPWPNANGAMVAFYSTATNLVSSPPTSGTQVYERSSSGFVLVSHSQPGTGGAVVAGNGVSRLPMMSADGGTIVYDTTSSNITNSTIAQAVAYNTATGQNAVVSACRGSCANGGTPGTRGNHPTGLVYSDANAMHMAFVSNATNISMPAPTGGKKSLFLWTPANGPVWEDIGNFYTGGPAIGSGGTTVAWTQSLTSGFNQPSGRVYAMIVP